MESNLSYRALIALTVTGVMAGAATAKGSPEEIEKLGKSLTCIAQEAAGFGGPPTTSTMGPCAWPRGSTQPTDFSWLAPHST